MLARAAQLKTDDGPSSSTQQLGPPDEIRVRDQLEDGKVLGLTIAQSLLRADGVIQ